MVKERGIKIRASEKSRLSRLTDGKAHQNVVLRCSRLEVKKFKNYNEFKKEIPKSSGNIYLLLDKIIDPHTFGSIIQTALYMGADGIVISIEGSGPISPVVAKASLGATELLPLYQLRYIGNFLDTAKSDNWKVIASGCSGENCKIIGEDSLIEKNKVIITSIIVQYIFGNIF